MLKICMIAVGLALAAQSTTQAQFALVPMEDVVAELSAEPVLIALGEPTAAQKVSQKATQKVDVSQKVTQKGTSVAQKGTVKRQRRFLFRSRRSRCNARRCF